MRLGKIRTPYFRIVVTDSRKARNGLSIEEIGRYAPNQEPSLIEVNSERALYWLGTGATPTAAVEQILKITGDWQKAKGLPGGSTLKVAPAKASKLAAYEAAVKQAQSEPAEGATTLKKKAQEKLAAKSAPVAEEAPAAESVAEVSGESAEAPVVEATSETVETPETTEAAAE